MPITHTRLTGASGEYDGTDATSYTTGTITPGGTNRALVLFVHTGNTGTAAIPTVTGLGLTWTQRASVAVNNTRRTTVFTAEIGSTAVTPGALTISCGTTTQVFAFWSVIEVVGAKTGADLVAATATGAAYSTTATAAMPAAGTNNLVLMAHVRSVQEAVTAPTGFTELAEVQQGGVTFAVNQATGPQTAPSYALGATSRNWTMVTVELAELVTTAAPGGGGTPAVDTPTTSLPRRGQAFRVRYNAVDSSGEFVTAALTSPTVHVSKDDGEFVVATNSLTALTLPGGGNSGVYRVDLTPAEMTASVVTVRVDASNAAGATMVLDTREAAGVGDAVWSSALASYGDAGTFGEALNIMADWLGDPVDGLDVERVQTAVANVPQAVLASVVGELSSAPSAAPTIESLLGYLYLAARNDLLRNAAGQVVLHRFNGSPFLVADTQVGVDGSIRRKQFLDPGAGNDVEIPGT